LFYLNYILENKVDLLSSIYLQLYIYVLGPVKIVKLIKTSSTFLFLTNLLRTKWKHRQRGFIELDHQRNFF